MLSGKISEEQIGRLHASLEKRGEFLSNEREEHIRANYTAIELEDIIYSLDIFYLNRDGRFIPVRFFKIRDPELGDVIRYETKREGD